MRVLETNQVYIHAKIICADCSATAGRVFVGSENFSTSSLDYNRELGIITSDPSVVGPVEATVLGDYAAGNDVEHALFPTDAAPDRDAQGAACAGSTGSCSPSSNAPITPVGDGPSAPAMIDCARSWPPKRRLAAA